MPDIKEISQTIATDFVAAVKAAELADAQEIDNIMRSQNDAWAIYVDKLSKIGTKRMELLEEQNAAENIYHAEMQTLSSRLDKYRLAKGAGAGPKSDMDRPAKPNGKLEELGR